MQITAKLIQVQPIQTGQGKNRRMAQARPHRGN